MTKEICTENSFNFFRKTTTISKLKSNPQLSFVAFLKFNMSGGRLIDDGWVDGEVLLDDRWILCVIVPYILCTLNIFKEKHNF